MSYRVPNDGNRMSAARTTNRGITRWTLKLTAAGVAVAALIPGVAAASPRVPSSDPFYAYSGSLRSMAPGAVLRTRQVTVSASGAPLGLTATQVLYRTTNQLGEP